MLLHCALQNLEDGALVQEPDTELICRSRYYDFGRLQRLFATAADEPPHIIGINEAKEWGTHGGRALNFAAEVLSETLGRRYVGLPGWLPVGLFGPALFYDATTLVLESWGDDHDTVSLDKRNLGRFHEFGQRGTSFQVFIDHWPFWSGAAREDRASHVSNYGDSSVPTLFIGDLNSTASGEHLPQRDWYAPGIRHRCHKGKLVDGVWVADTAAVDMLIGAWDGGRRLGGEGLHACEEAGGITGAHAAVALLPTVNTGVDRGGGLLIDWALHNEAWLGGVVPGSVRVEIPDEREEGYDSNHRRKTWSMNLGTA